jgi:hypothetical protein
MKKQSLVFLLVTALLWGITAERTEASSTGSLSGVIKDTNGAPLAGAVVTLLEGSFNPKVRTRVISDGAGRFEIRYLVPGLYSLSVRIANYTPLLRTGIEILAGKIADLNLVLENLYQQTLGSGGLSAGPETGVQEDIESVLRTVSSTRPILRVLESDQEEPSVIAVNLEADRASYRRREDFQGVVNVYTAAYSSNADLASLGGIFTQFALARDFNPKMRWVVAGVASDTGFAEVDSALKLRDVNGHSTSVRLSFGQLPYFTESSSGHGDYGRRMNLFNLDFQDEMKIGNSVFLAYGAEMQGTNPALDVRRFRPRMMVGVQPFRNQRFTFARTSSLPRSQRAFSLPEGETIVLSSPFQHEYGSPLNLGTSRVTHAEFSTERMISGGAAFSVAAYSDSFSPKLSSFWGDPGSDRRPSNKGVRVAYHRALGSRMDGAFGYTLGGGIRPALEGTQFFPQNVHVLVAQISTEFPSSKTRVTSTYRWVSAYSITVIDPYQEVFESSSPGVSFMVTQLIPYFGRFIPGKLEAQVDVRTLLTRTNPDFYSMASVRRLEFLQPPKSVRGGIQLKF